MKKKGQNYVYILMLICFLTSIAFALVLNYMPDVVKRFSMLLFSLAACFIILRQFFTTNIKWVLGFFLCTDQTWWEAKIQRPRIFVYVLYFLFFIPLLSQLNNILIIFPLLVFYIFYTITGAVILGVLIWRKGFEDAVLPMAREMITSKVLFKELTDIEVQRLLMENIENIHEDCIEDFKLLLQRKTITKPIIWKGTSGKKSVTYTGLLILLHQIVEDAECKLSKSRRKEGMNFLIQNFVKFESEGPKRISYGTLYSAYTNFNLRDIAK